MRPLRLAIRSAGGAGIGSGHFARCLALAQAWCDAGGEAYILDPSMDGRWRQRFAVEGVGVRAEGSPPPDWLVVDGYELAAVRHGAGTRILRIDDHGASGVFDADLVLDQNAGAAYAPYAAIVERRSVLLGSAFALLRREFALHRGTTASTPVEPVGRRLLVSVGGNPPARVERWFAQAALSWVGDDPVWLRGMDDVVTPMSRADVALAAAGSTCWELACMGLPAVVSATAPNQTLVATAVQRAGAALNIGPIERTGPDVAALALLTLMADPERRQAMSVAGRSLVDGLGARRVVAEMRSRTIALRAAEQPDEGLLLAWSNDPVTRASAFNPAPIGVDEHRRWFADRLLDPSTSIFIAEGARGEPIGQIRFDRRGDAAEIDVTVAPASRGQRWAAPLICAGVERYLSEESGVAMLIADVKADNHRSRRAFELARFQLNGDEGDRDGGRWLRYVRRRDG